jgi:hypothetical protein
MYFAGYQDDAVGFFDRGDSSEGLLNRVRKRLMRRRKPLLPRNHLISFRFQGKSIRTTPINSVSRPWPGRRSIASPTRMNRPPAAFFSTRTSFFRGRAKLKAGRLSSKRYRRGSKRRIIGMIVIANTIVTRENRPIHPKRASLTRIQSIICDHRFESISVCSRPSDDSSLLPCNRSHRFWNVHTVAYSVQKV